VKANRFIVKNLIKIFIKKVLLLFLFWNMQKSKKRKANEWKEEPKSKHKKQRLEPRLCQKDILLCYIGVSDLVGLILSYAFQNKHHQYRTFTLEMLFPHQVHLLNLSS
jgi:hypothetical protein